MYGGGIGNDRTVTNEPRTPKQKAFLYPKIVMCKTQTKEPMKPALSSVTAEMITLFAQTVEIQDKFIALFGNVFDIANDAEMKHYATSALDEAAEQMRKMIADVVESNLSDFQLIENENLCI